MRSLVEILTAARKRIEDPKHWTKGAFARDAEGNPTAKTRSSDAVCWCSHGAVLFINEAAGEVSRATGLLNDKVILRGYANVAHFNDDPHTTHADVLALFDAAIEDAKAKGD